MMFTTQRSGQITFRVSKQSSSQTAQRAGGKHQIGACCSCKAKKKKCDGAYPICGGCMASGQDCTVVDLATSRVVPRNYIETLEAEIQSLKQDNASLKTKNVSKRDLEMEIGYITLGAGSESNGYLGNSSAYSIAKAITSTISYYNRKPSDKEDLISTPPEISEEFNNIPFTMPSHTMSRNYLTSYYDNVHCQYPFLDWGKTSTNFEIYLNNNGQSEDLFFIYMIFAIGSQVYSNYSSSSSIYTKMYYDKAMEHIGPLMESTSLKTVQAYLMLSVFSQKMPDASSIWQTIGLAIRTSVILGLHRSPYRRNSGSEEDKEDQLKRRIFWCTYGMERINGIVLGRPFGISDIDIDLELPIATRELSVSNHVIKIRRIQSSIYTFVYTPLVNVDSSKDIDSTRIQIVLELNNWMSTFPSKLIASSVFETRNWAEISYHNSMLLLLRPIVLEVATCPNGSRPSDRSTEWFKVFTQSASVICMNYKQLHSKGKLGYTWLTMHCVFVSGLSFLYCLWIDNKLQVLELRRRGLIYDTVRSCSSILYVFAERFKKAAVFRDTFERISNTVLFKIDNNDDVRPPQSGQQKVVGCGGVLDERSIGIDQYLDYDPARLWQSIEEIEAPQDTNQTESEGAPVVSPIDSSFWEFLDTTGDKFMRDIFHDMKLSLTESSI